MAASGTWRNGIAWKWRVENCSWAIVEMMFHKPKDVLWRTTERTNPCKGCQCLFIATRVE
jgi:hypothetical protein